MRVFIRLLQGELKRMVSYKILPVSVATSLIWVGIFAVLSAQEARRFAPLLLYMDAGLMSLLLSGAFHHLERTDGTAKTMMVLPVSTGQIIASKAFAAAILGLLSALVISVALIALHGIVLRYAALALFVFVIAAAHSAIGLALALKSRDFTSTLGWVMLFILLSLLPSVLLDTGIIPRAFENWVLLSPSGAATAMLDYAAGSSGDAARAAMGFFYLAALALLLYRFPVLKLFRQHACVG